jgi:hypothetical protein
MWILPKQLHTSDFVPDMEVLNLDFNESSQICAQSLFVRSKPSPARTWLQKWKRDSWTQHLYGRILKPSLGQSFVTAWTSSLEATPASHSPQQGSEQDKMTPGTSGHISQAEFGFCDQESASLKTSKDISLWGCPTLSKTWQDWVIERRGAYSLRVKSVRPTSGNGCSSWPTVTANEDSYRINGDSQQSKCLSAMARRGEMQNAWQTPTTNMDMVRSEEGVQKRIAFRASIGRKSIPDGNLGEQMQRLHGPAAPANWPTPMSRDCCPPGQASREGRQVQLANMVLHGPAAPANPSTDGSRRGLWRTPKANEPQEDWQKVAERRERMRQAGDTQTGDLLSLNQQVQKMQWATPKASDPQHSGPNMRDSAGNYALPAQAVREQWGTPTARDHKSGRGNEEREYKELTPMVERTQTGKLNPRWVDTLMGLPVGWTMPSCAYPVTIEPTSCDCLATE